MLRKKVLTMLVVLAMVLSLAPALTASGAPPLLTAVGDPVQENAKSFTETVGVRFEEEFKMVFVEGGTFTLGWEEGTPGVAPEDTLPVPGVKISDYWISETVVTNALWNAVMGQAAPTTATRNNARTSSTWYDAQEFLARLYVLTGKVYYMPTEAQWEYAAKGGRPGYAAGHNLLPFPGSLTQSAVAVSSGAVKQRLPNILGIYDLSGLEEWTWNPWNTAHIGGVDPTGIESPIHSQKTRRGGLSSTGQMEYHCRLIRSIDGTGPAFRIALSADQSSVPPGMTKPRDIHVPKLDDRDTPNSYRDPRWITGDDMVWEGNYQGYGGGAMKVWETGEVVLRPHNFNGYDPGDIIGQWYTFNNYGMVIIPNADSPNPDKSRMLIPYMFLDQFTVSTINDRKNANTAGSDVVWPDIYMAPTGRLELKYEASLKASIEANKPAAPNPPEQFGQNYESHPYFGGVYELIQKPVVPGLVALEDLEAGVGIVAANHQLWDVGNGNTNTFPTEARSQDLRLVDGTDCGWWMGYGFGGIHTYRKDIELNGNFRFSVYEAAEGTNITAQTGNLARGPWFTVNDMFLRVQTNAGGTGYVDYLYLIVPDIDGKVLNANNYPFRHLSYQSYERGDSRIFLLRENKDIERHPYEQGGLTGYASMGPTTWRIAPSARTACPGIPNPVGTQLYCTVNGARGNVMNCTCPVYCQICQSHFCEGHVLASGPESVTYEPGATASYKLYLQRMPNINALEFTISVDGDYFETDSFKALNDFMILGDPVWKNVGGSMWEADVTLITPSGATDGDMFEITFRLKNKEGSSTDIEFKNVSLALTGGGGFVSGTFGDIVTVEFLKWYSKYDINKDGNVDLLDISLAVDFFMVSITDGRWMQAMNCDVNDDGVIDIEDLILIRANYT